MVRGDDLISAPRDCYLPTFDVKQHDYEPEDVESRDFVKLLNKYRETGRPVILILTQREGRYLSVGYPDLYLRMDYEGGKLTWGSARSDRFTIGGQVWDQDVVTVHVHLQNTCFWVGSTKRNVLLPTFLEELHSLLKLKDKFPWAGVALAGGSNDIYWFCSPSSPRGSGPNGSVLIKDTVVRFTDLIRERSGDLYKGFREYSPDCELIVVGTG